MGILIRLPVRFQELVEKRMRYRFGHKEGERSRHALRIAENTDRPPGCPMHHDETAWSGPPHNKVRQIICLRCGASANEFHVKEMGYQFDDHGPGNCPDYVIEDLMDEELRRRVKNPSIFVAHK